MVPNHKIGIGTVQFGMPYGISNATGQTSSQEVKKILDYALQHNIDLLDTASAYGNAEEVLGRNNLSKFRIVSKCMPGDTLEQFNSTLKKLNVQSLYGYLAHRPMELIQYPEQWRALKELKAKGLVKKIGFSVNEPRELTELEVEQMNPDLIQVPFNYFDTRFATEMARLKARGCEIHVRSAFLQGLFFLDMDKARPFFDEVKDVVRNLQQSVNRLPGALINFVVEKPFVDQVILGIENVQQLASNLDDMTLARTLPEFNRTVADKILMPSYWPKS